MPAPHRLLPFLLVIACACAGAGAAPASGPALPSTPPYPLDALLEDGARNAYRWPFASDSIWNTPIGSGAAYVPARIPAARARVGGAGARRAPAAPPARLP